MSGFSLSTNVLEARDLAQDKARLESRLEAYREVEPAAAPPLIIEPGAAAPMPEEPIVPEVSAEALTGEVLRESIATHGALIVRDMLPPEQLASMTSAIDGVLEACDSPRQVRNKLANHYFNPPGNIVSIMPDKAEELSALRVFSAIANSALCIESPSIAEMLLEFFEQHGIRDIAKNYLGEDPVLSVKKWVLRRSELPMAEAGWHQDGAFMGTHINTLNLWIPLTECGGASGAPGMDLIPQRLTEIQSADGATFDWSVSDDQANKTGNRGGPVAPVFNVGDAFFFDHFYLHRTQYREDFTRLRYAIETWFFGASAFPKSQVPIAW